MDNYSPGDVMTENKDRQCREGDGISPPESLYRREFEYAETMADGDEAGAAESKEEAAERGEVPAAGLIRTFIGGGKGKTWAALGLVLRAVSFGMKVHVVQFAKSQTSSEPLSLLEKQLPLFKIDTFGQHCPFVDLLKNSLIHCSECRKCYVDPRSPKQMDREIAEMAFEMCEGVVKSGLYDVLVMDEVLRALEFKLIEPERVLAFLKGKPENLEIVLTGPVASREIIALSDSVTYLVPIKRPSKKNFKPRRGIDH